MREIQRVTFYIYKLFRCIYEIIIRNNADSDSDRNKNAIK
jgi:hypothetical protein